MIAAATRLYVPDGALIADVTFGPGAFWRLLGGTTRFRVIGSDLHPGEGARVAADFRRLPYKDQSVDIVVLDPPYMHHGGKSSAPLRAARYNGHTIQGFDHRDIIELYRLGMVEAVRVLRAGGMVWVKCQDEIESARQCRSHIEIYQIARDLGLRDQDKFVVASNPMRTRRWQRQMHAHKNHSYLWIFSTNRL